MKPSAFIELIIVIAAVAFLSATIGVLSISLFVQ